MYAVVLIRNFSLQALLRSGSFPAKSPLAVTRESGSRSVISQVNAKGKKSGVIPGMTISQALAKCRDLQVFSRKPLAEQSAHKAVFVSLYQITPLIEETSEAHYTLQLSGIAEADRKKRIQTLLDSLKDLGFYPQIGVAVSAMWAYYAALCAQPLFWVEDCQRFFDEVSIEVAVEEEKLRTILKQWGIRTLGDFAAMPQPAVAKRLGKPGIQLWRSLHEPEQRILKIKSPPQEYDAKMELEYAIDSLEPLQFLLNRLLEQLCLQLKQCFLFAKVLILELGLEDRTQYRRIFKLPEPTTRKAALQQILDTHLEQLQTGSGICIVRVEAIPTQAKAPQSQLFQHQAKDPWKMASTLHQLIGLVGSENVGRPQPTNDHRPDAFTMESLPQVLETPAKPGEGRGRLTTQLKLQRFRPPQKTQVRLNKGIPRWFQIGGHDREILSIRGPWHLSGNWWDQRAWKRMEWDVETEQEGLYRIAYSRGQWWVEGAYG